jgi:hypothetical protein
MFDTIRISRRTEQGAYFDQSKGQTVYPAPTVIYEGKAYVAPMGIPTNSKYREEDVAQTTYEIAIPYNAAQVEPQDDVLVLTSAYNPKWVGYTFIVKGEIGSTFETHTRLSARLDRSAT